MANLNLNLGGVEFWKPAVCVRLMRQLMTVAARCGRAAWAGEARPRVCACHVVGWWSEGSDGWVSRRKASSSVYVAPTSNTKSFVWVS
jgi:hypothetical protein